MVYISALKQQEVVKLNKTLTPIKRIIECLKFIQCRILLNLGINFLSFFSLNRKDKQPRIVDLS